MGCFVRIFRTRGEVDCRKCECNAKPLAPGDAVDAVGQGERKDGMAIDSLVAMLATETPSSWEHVAVSRNKG